MAFIITLTITSLIFLGVAFAITKENASHFLSGYNTMSEKEREKFDLSKYLTFFRQFHIFLAISYFMVTVGFHYLVSPEMAKIVLVAYPILAYIYFVIRGNSIARK